METESLMSVREVAAMTSVQTKTVYGWTYRNPPLRVQRRDRRVFIRKDDLDEFLAARLRRSRSSVAIVKAEMQSVSSALVNAIENPAQEPASGSDTASPVSCGQRELNYRWRDSVGTSIVMFTYPQLM